MGLDTYAAYNRDGFPLMEASLFPDNCLCGGLFSGGTGNSFRGKVYADFLEYISKISLYQEVMPNEEVGKLATDIEWARKSFPEGYEGITPEEMKDLARWFQIVYDNEGVVLGWW